MRRDNRGAAARTNVSVHAEVRSCHVITATRKAYLDILEARGAIPDAQDDGGSPQASLGSVGIDQGAHRSRRQSVHEGRATVPLSDVRRSRLRPLNRCDGRAMPLIDPVRSRGLEQLRQLHACELLWKKRCKRIRARLTFAFPNSARIEHSTESRCSRNGANIFSWFISSGSRPSATRFAVSSRFASSSSL